MKKKCSTENKCITKNIYKSIVSQMHGLSIYKCGVVRTICVYVYVSEDIL